MMMMMMMTDGTVCVPFHGPSWHKLFRKVGFGPPNKTMEKSPNHFICSKPFNLPAVVRAPCDHVMSPELKGHHEKKTKHTRRETEVRKNNSWKNRWNHGKPKDIILNSRIWVFGFDGLEGLSKPTFLGVRSLEVAKGECYTHLLKTRPSKKDKLWSW